MSLLLSKGRISYALGFIINGGPTIVADYTWYAQVDHPEYPIFPKRNYLGCRESQCGARRDES